MDYQKIIHTIVDPFLINPDALLIREIKSDDDKELTLLIVSESEDTARLIGKKGTVANALREVLSVAGKNGNIRLRLKFESFDEETK